MPKFIDLTGNTYGRLTIVSLVPREKGEPTRWNCICSCGNEYVGLGSSIKHGNTTSCGCVKREMLVQRNEKHGLSELPEYSVWKDIKKRCYNKNNSRYENYSAKGITVADEFLNDFPAWLDHVGRRPSDGQRWCIGRIDNNIGYVRGNMEWQLDKDQAKAHSLQSNNKTGVCGVNIKVKTIDGKEYVTYQATLNVDNNRYRKEFSVLKYGEDAFQMAVDYRNYLMSEYGKDFHPSHGKPALAS